MTHHTSTSAKRAMTAPRLYLSLVATMFAIAGIMSAPQNAAAHDYHKHSKSSFAIQFHFGNPVVSTRTIHRPHYHAPKYTKKRYKRPVIHTCSPLKAKHVARHHYKLRHARITRVDHNKIVILGRKRGVAKWMSFGHNCKRLSH